MVSFDMTMIAAWLKARLSNACYSLADWDKAAGVASKIWLIGFIELQVIVGGDDIAVEEVVGSSVVVRKKKGEVKGTVEPSTVGKGSEGERVNNDEKDTDRKEEGKVIKGRKRKEFVATDPTS